MNSPNTTITAFYLTGGLRELIPIYPLYAVMMGQDGISAFELSVLFSIWALTGIITEITVKLHTWVGGSELPEPEAGRPCIPLYFKPTFDTAPPPRNHRLYWLEFPDYDAEIKAYREIAHSGIGIGLNASGVYSAYYCSQTQQMTEERVK